MLVLEYANKGTLQEYLKLNFSKIDWNTKLKLSEQIVSGLKCLHENNIIHGNLVSI